MKNEAGIFFLALQFLTRIPLPSNDFYTGDRMAESVRYYPLVGLIVGAFLAVIYWLVHFILPHSIAVICAVGTGLLVTGALHEDGLGDMFDGIGSGKGREKILAIMKDSRLGTCGTLAIIIALALKLESLGILDPGLVVLALFSSHGLSRFSSVLVIATSQYVREEGTGKPVARALSGTSKAIILATVMGILVLWCILSSPMGLFYACGGLVLGHIAMRVLYERKLGGYTGDTLGAVQQASETGFYLGLAAWA